MTTKTRIYKLKTCYVTAARYCYPVTDEFLAVAGTACRAVGRERAQINASSIGVGEWLVDIGGGELAILTDSDFRRQFEEVHETIR